MKGKKRKFQNVSKRTVAMLLAFVLAGTNCLPAMATNEPFVTQEEGETLEFVSVKNGSFEEELTKRASGEKEEGWIVSAEEFRTGKEAYTGKFSALLSAENCEISQEITGLIKGMTYTVNFMAKKEKEDSGSFYFGVRSYGEDEKKLMIHSLDWESYSFDFTVTGEEKVVLFGQAKEVAGEAYIDQVSISPKGNLAHLGAENGEVRVYYNTPEMAAKDSFTIAASVNGGEYQQLSLVEQEKGSKERVLLFDKVEANGEEQQVSLRVSYFKGEGLQEDYNSTTDYLLEYTVAAIPGGEISSHTAAVGLLSEEETEAVNLLFNPGFEEEMTNVATGVGNLVGNWNRYFTAGSNQSDVERTSEVKRTGEYAGVIASNGGAIEQDINNLQVGKTYIFKAYVKLSEGATGTDFILGAKNYASGNDEQKVSVNSSEWTEMSVQFTYSDNSKPARVYLYAASANGAKAYIDDTVLMEKEEADTDEGEVSQGNTVYYVSNDGNDNNNGTSESTPFASINKLNSMTFGPGDRILFKKGDSFTGWFKPKGSGREGAPIVIASYGEGETKPILKPTTNHETTYLISGDNYQASARVNYVIQFVNVEYWEVRDLEIYDPSGTSDRSVFKSAITIQANDTLNPTELILDHFIIDNCNIHGFHGPLSNFGKTSGGITMNVITNSSRNASQAKKMQINGIQITNNEIWDVGRSGVNFLNVWSDRKDGAKWGTGFGTQKGLEWTPYEDFVLRNNYIHDVDGDGAIIDNTLNAVVEYNLVHDCVKNLVGGAQFAVGLFNWNATNTTFQYNEVFDIQFGGDWAADCEGIEIDAWNDETYVQYNYVHDNRGGFMMFCSHTQNDGDKSGLRSYNNVVRYNISQNDYAHPFAGVFNLGEWAIGGDIYNNTLYFTDRGLMVNERNDADCKAGEFYMFQSIGGKKMLRFYNNIFYYDYENTPSGEKVKINKFGDEHIDYRSNIFYGFTNKPIDDDPKYPNLHLDAEDPDILTNPGGAGKGTYVKGNTKLGYQTDLSAYHLPEGSPAINNGIYIEDNGGKDYFGNPVVGIPDIGAHETGSTALKVLSHVYEVNQESENIQLPEGDNADGEKFLENLIYDPGLAIKLLREETELTTEEILQDNDRLQIQYQGETLIYTIELVEGISPVGDYIPVEYLVASAGSEETTSEQQQAGKVLDNDPRTLWHTKWTGSTQDQHWITIQVTRPYLITGYEYTPRLGGSMSGATNGIVTEYEIETSTDGSTWVKQAEGNSENGKAWFATHSVKTVTFDKAVEASHVKLKVLSGVAGHATAAEIRLLGIPLEEGGETPETPENPEVPEEKEKAVLDENQVYWVYSVAADGQGGYAPSEQRVLFDNGNEKANSGYMNTANTMFSNTMPDAQLRRRLLKSAWQFEAVAGEEGTYYLQNGFTYGYGGSSESGSNGVATVGGGQKEKYLVTIEEVAADGKQYVSIRSVTRKAAGQASYLKAQNTTPGGDAGLSVSFGAVADKSQGTLWYLGEGHSFMDWENGVYLWRTARGDQHFRIPALATANDGDVIAIGDLRYNHNGDLGNGHEIDLLRKVRPYDAITGTYGSFGSELNITKSFRNSNEGYGDAAIVADRESDQVLVLAAYGTEGYSGNNKASRILSTDGGETFGTGVDISPQIRGLNSNIHSFFFGSGRIMQSRYIKVGTHYRIYSAILACDTGGTENNVNYVLYSDDFGLTWKILGNTSVIEKTGNHKADEAKIEELPNGDVVINSRNGNLPGRYLNVFSYAVNPDGTKNYESGTWEASKTKQIYEGGDITSQGTNGELMTVFAKKKDGTYTHLLLQSLPSSQAAITGGSHTDRKSVTVWYKEVADVKEDSDITGSELAADWKKGRVVQDNHSAYSTMTIQADGSIGFFYEDSMTWYDLIYYNFSLEEMTGAGGALGDYTMAYQGMGSKKVPYMVDSREKAEAYRDVFGAEKVNWYFSEEALEALLSENGEIQGTNGEMVAEAWKALKEAAEANTITSEATAEQVINLLAQQTTEGITLAKAGELQFNTEDQQPMTAQMDITIAYENITAKAALQLPVKEGGSVSDQEIGEILPEDVPADGMIPEGIWVAGITDKEYTGTKQVQNFRVYHHKKMLKEKVDYTYSYKNNQNGYEYSAEDFEKFKEELAVNPNAKGYDSFETKKAPQVVLKMKGNYTKTVCVYFQIIKPDIENEKEFLTDNLYVTYNKKKQTPTPLVIWTENGTTLKLNKDFTVKEYDESKKDNSAFKEYREEGYELTLKGIGNFKGERELKLYITEDLPQIALNNTGVKLEYTSVVYDGNEKTPTVSKITYKKETLKEGVHYQIAGYRNNASAGTACVILEALEGSGYVGTKCVTFKITGIPMNKVKVNLPKEGFVYTGEEIKPLSMTEEEGKQLIQVTYTDKGVSRTLEEGIHFTVSYEKNVVTGTGSIILKGISKGGFTGEKKQSFKITAAPLLKDGDYQFKVSAPNLTGDGMEAVYTMPIVKGGVMPKVEIIYKDQKAMPLEEGVDFTVAYPKNKAPGSTVIKITGKGNFKGSVEIPLTIIPKNNQLHTEAGEEVRVEAKDKLQTVGKKNGWKTTIKVVDRDGKALSAKEGGIKEALYYLVEVPRGSSFVPSEEIPLTEGSIMDLPAGSVIKVVTALSGNYQGTASGTYRILEEGKDISKATIQLYSREYKGEPVTIEDDSFIKKAVIKSKGGDTYLYLTSTEGREANIEVVSYENNLKKGTAKVTFRGKEEAGFGGTKTVTFKITAKSVWKEFWKGLF